MINITFPDGSSRKFAAGTTPLQIAESISPRLAEETFAATVNGESWDVQKPIDTDAEIKLHKWDDPQAKHAFWHSSSHLLAAALEQLYPGIKFGIGPAIDNQNRTENARTGAGKTTLRPPRSVQSRSDGHLHEKRRRI